MSWFVGGTTRNGDNEKEVLSVYRHLQKKALVSLLSKHKAAQRSECGYEGCLRMIAPERILLSLWDRPCFLSKHSNNLPEMDGASALKEVRKVDHEIPLQLQYMRTCKPT